jgi:AcrR family transcriptional regulator
MSQHGGDAHTARDLFVPDFHPADTRQRLLVTATNLFYAHGIHAIGLDRVIGEVGVTKTTFYNHFESKDELIYEAMRWRDAWERELWSQMIRDIAGDDPRGQLLAYFDVLHIWFTDERFRGCQFINAAAEFPALHDPAHEVAREHVEFGRNAATQMARDAGIRDAPAFAEEYSTILIGTIVHRQVTGNNDAAKIGRRTAELLIDRYLGRG